MCSNKNLTQNKITYNKETYESEIQLQINKIVKSKNNLFLLSQIIKLISKHSASKIGISSRFDRLNYVQE